LNRWPDKIEYSFLQPSDHSLDGSGDVSDWLSLRIPSTENLFGTPSHISSLTNEREGTFSFSLADDLYLKVMISVK
jgi:hypothetical protein